MSAAVVAGHLRDLAADPTNRATIVKVFLVVLKRQQRSNKV